MTTQYWSLYKVAYYSYTQYQCQLAKERYERALGTLSATEIPRYLIEYQQACRPS